MDPKLQAQIKEYLSNNLSMSFDIQSDIYNPVSYTHLTLPTIYSV